MAQPTEAPVAKPSLAQKGKNRLAERAAPLIAAALGPSERIWTGARIETGMSRWWVLLSTYLLLFRKYYYMALTEHHVVLCRISFWTGRPTKVEYATPRGEVRVSDYRPGTMFASFMYTFPDRGRPARVRVHRIWRPEIESLLGQLGALGPSTFAA